MLIGNLNVKLLQTFHDDPPILAYTWKIFSVGTVVDWSCPGSLTKIYKLISGSACQYEPPVPNTDGQRTLMVINRSHNSRWSPLHSLTAVTAGQHRTIDSQIVPPTLLLLSNILGHDTLFWGLKIDFPNTEPQRSVCPSLKYRVTRPRAALGQRATDTSPYTFNIMAIYFFWLFLGMLHICIVFIV